jgi:regulatory protein
MDAYTTALALLAKRELSSAQLRTRLARRKFPGSEIDEALARLTHDGTLNDRRVAEAAARLEGNVRRRGRRRAMQRLLQLGISAEIAADAVDAVFSEIDEAGLLDAALEHKLKGADPGTLDDAARARIVRSLVAQGFDAGDVLNRLRKKR